MALKYTFSGHESFPCKSLWLKKGFDFCQQGGSFSSPQAVVSLGVGKNMVTSINYWMKAFQLLKDNQLSDIAQYIFDEERGKDPYLEDIATIWILHYLLASRKENTLYNWTFTQFQRERKSFTKEQLEQYVKRVMVERDAIKLFNENTVHKDVLVLCQNYIRPNQTKNYDEFSQLLIELNLISELEGKQNGKTLCHFNTESKSGIPLEIVLFAILYDMSEETTFTFDMLRKIGLIFCMTDSELIAVLQSISQRYPQHAVYSDVAGVKQLQLIKELTWKSVLDNYYNNETL